jgi:hypothetical protein
VLAEDQVGTEPIRSTGAVTVSGSLPEKFRECCFARWCLTVLDEGAQDAEFSKPLQALANVENFTEDGHLRTGDKYLR